MTIGLSVVDSTPIATLIPNRVFQLRVVPFLLIPSELSQLVSNTIGAGF